MRGIITGYRSLSKKYTIKQYLNSDRRPWRTGYHEYKQYYLDYTLKNTDLLTSFKSLKNLPENYGYRLDARVVEIPWVLSHINNRPESILDAGSSLNNEVTICAPSLKNKKITILTLAPESIAFWDKGVSYVFGDLRNIYFKDESFDVIVCISTIEHIGMDNSMYTRKKTTNNPEKPNDFIIAVKELKRILKSGGTLFCTFPFGKYENHGWFQQFDSGLIDVLKKEFAPAEYEETIFKYNPEGWIVSSRQECSDCEFFDVHTSKYFDPSSTIEYPPDYPAGERAVACLKLIK